MTSSALGAVLDSIEGGTVNIDASEATGGEDSILSRIRARRADSPSYRRDLIEVAGLYGKVLKGSRPAAADFLEAMTSSDFSNLFGDVVDRQLYAKYMSKRAEWTMYAKRAVVNDFRAVKRFTLDGGEAFLTAVAERAPYPAAALTDGAYTYSVAKYGRTLGLSWESIVNDDLDAFRDLPERLANAAIRSEDRFVTDLYANAAGPDATYFSAGNKNLIAAGATSALSLASLQAGFTLLSKQLDTDGGPIYVEGVTLVVPPALEVAAQNILNGTLINVAAGSSGLTTDATRNDQLVAVNWMSKKLNLVVNPMLPLVSITGTFGDTAWYMFANPNVGRPAMEVGFLRGRETPELFAKTSNATRIGGGIVGQEEGDFDTDQAIWKVRHTFGGLLMDVKSAVGSFGQ